jgi:hypothetical protein
MSSTVTIRPSFEVPQSHIDEVHALGDHIAALLPQLQAIGTEMRRLRRVERDLGFEDLPEEEFPAAFAAIGEERVETLALRAMHYLDLDERPHADIEVTDTASAAG